MSFFNFIKKDYGIGFSSPNIIKTAWDVAGVTNATKDHTLVRKCEIFSGNTDWMASAGTSEQDSEWIVLDIDDL